MSLEGPITAVINSTTAPPNVQSFSLQPYIDQPPELTTSYANVTLAGGQQVAYAVCTQLKDLNSNHHVYIQFGTHL